MSKLFSISFIVAIVIIAAAFILSGSYEQLPQIPDENIHSEDISPVSPWRLVAGDTDILLVNQWNPLPDDFECERLVTLYDYKDRSFALAYSHIQLEKAVYEAMDEMFAAAKLDGVDDFIISSGYRSREKQEELYNENGGGTTALPGHSEHETGLAFDVTTYGSADGFDTTPQFDWLIENCWDYGFILRYPKGKESITGIPYESWHYRYVGLPHSLAIRNLNITLEEYLAER